MEQKNNGDMMESIDPTQIKIKNEKVGEYKKPEETMEAIDADEIKRDREISAESKKTEDSMDSIDLSEYREREDLEITNAAKPIEVKSTQHIERAKAEEARRENIENAHSAAAEVFDWFESILTAVVAIVLIFTFIVRINTVSGDSMKPTLQNGQKLIVTDMFYTPDYNDIVIVQAAKLEGGKPIVKRIIGLPGDAIKIDFEEGTVFRNGEALDIEVKDGVIYEDGHMINALTNNNITMESGREYTVPENCYFVMGDNRNDSRDSRDMNTIGFVEENYIAGRAIFSIFPFDSFGTV